MKIIMIGILSCAYKRYHLFELFLQGLKRLKNVRPVIVGDEFEIQELCKKYQVYYCKCPNYPLGRKFNFGLNAFRVLPVDYVMVLGSDDFICDNTLEVYQQYMKQGYDLIGTTDIYFFDAKTKRFGYFPGYSEMAKTDSRYKCRIGESLGAGRCLSRKLLASRNFKIWPNNANAGLDWEAMQRLRNCKRISFSCKEKGIMIVDVKTGENFNGFDSYKTELIDNKLFYDKIPESKWI